ncbi:MAG TPA: DUF3159 domain-containing protein [Atribacterota bacterium]|jgi:hypothetical protein|nr:DUF3159 domain-containing protein [Atribacterota bacterium]
MMVKRKEILEEINSIISGKTLDALLPPLIFVLINSVSGLNMAVVISLGFAIFFSIIRLVRKQNWKYALGGLVGVSLASGLAYLTRNPALYFIGPVLSSSLLLFLALASLLAGKPLAAWASHLSRGWPLKWYWRRDVKPAYREVTWFWTALILIRLLIQISLLQIGDISKIAWANILLGWPATLSVLIASYIYGIWRLNQLGGPGIEEYQEGKKPPWKGQTRGF